jgi:multiple sugar transport system permease protein
MLEGRELHLGLSDIRLDRPKQTLFIIFIYAILIAGAIAFLLPLFWLITTALKENSEVYIFPPTFIPKTLRWQNFPDGWFYKEMHFPLWTWNTIFITVTVTVSSIIAASLCAYGFARIKFPGRDIWFMMVLASIMLPGAVTLIPLYIIYSRIGWLGTFLPLIVPPFFGGGAFNIFLLRQFFTTIPLELEEAAILDGAGRFRIWWQIMLPLTKPALATVAVFTFQGVWNDFYGPLIFLTDPKTFTLALGISQFRQLYDIKIPLMMAMSFLMVIPTLIIFFFAQRLMIRGVVLTGIKA